LDLKTAEGKRAFTDILLATIRRLRDPVEQEHYLKEIAQLTDSSFEAVKAKLNFKPDAGGQARQKKTKIQPGPIDHETVEYQKLQDNLLAMALMQPKLRDLLSSCKASFFAEGNPRQVFEFLKQNPEFKGDPKVAKQLLSSGDYVKIIMLQFEELYQELPYPDLREQAENLKRRLIDRYAKTQRQKLITEIQATTDPAKQEKLLQKANKLNELIK
jgi:DNA primase